MAGFRYLSFRTGYGLEDGFVAGTFGAVGAGVLVADVHRAGLVSIAVKRRERGAAARPAAGAPVLITAVP